MNAVLAGLLSLFTASPEPVRLQGYIEGDYVRVGTPIPGTVAELRVREGETVAAGAALFSLDTLAERAARDQAAAQLAQAEALLTNMRKGKRPDEVTSLAAQRESAEASERLSAATLHRQEALAGPGFASRQALDQARATLERDRAIVAQSSADLRVARLGARDDEIAAQEAAVANGRAVLASADKRLSDVAPVAPTAALVQRVYYRPGEFVSPGQPVVSLLPPENIKLVFFVPEPQLGRLTEGQTVSFACDSCAAGMKASISFIATQVEYAPPVIYSVGSRDKLVIRVEARPLASPHPPALRPGQPADVIVGDP